MECFNLALIAYQTTYFEAASFASVYRRLMLWNGVRDMLVLLAWALYWVTAKRVRLTYGSNGFERASTAGVQLSGSDT
jgi:hypothetical protein